MRVRLFIKRTDALRAGKDVHGHKTIEVPAERLTGEQRETLARCKEGGSSDSFDFDLVRFPIEDYMTDLPPWPTITEFTVEAALRQIDWYIGYFQRLDEHYRQAEIQKTTALEAEIQQWLSCDLRECVDHSYRYDDLRYSFKATLEKAKAAGDTRLESRRAEALVLAKQLNAEYEAKQEKERQERQARNEEKKRQQTEATEQLKQWALAHGSELIRARIAGGFEWEGKAENAFADAIAKEIQGDLVPDNDGPDDYECEEVERTTPTLEEMKALEALRARLGEKPVTADIVWMKYTPVVNEYGYPDEDAKKYGETNLVIVVTCPNGQVTRRYFKLPDVEAITP